MPGRRVVVVAAVIAIALFAGARLAGRQQLPLSPQPKSGATVTPVFEGWYPNKDGTFCISFGYYNRNTEEAIDVPIGPGNFIGPGAQDQGQPSHFEPKRHWGVFAVKVPADFGKKEIVWTLTVRGETMAIPGNLHPNWQIDALEGEAGSGNTPPMLQWDEHGPDGSGPYGITSGPLKTTVGTPLTLTIWAKDDGKSAGTVATTGRGAVPVTLTWFKHQGPGAVKFTPATGRVPVTGGSATTAATFSEPGDYIVRVRANDASGVAGAGHAQCCWTNGFVKIHVTKQ
jgi:hypothetical protein